MDTLATAALTALIAYGLGSIPAAYLVGRAARKVDIRSEGEGNVGARNVFHEVGWKWGVAVFAADFGKGVAVALLYRNAPLWQLALAGAFVLIGHAYPVWLGFVGGKGLASALGFAIALMPWAGLLAFAVAGIAFGLTRRFMPTIVTAAPALFITAPFTGVPWETIAVAFGAFLLVALKRTIDEPRMRRIEAETGWDRERGGSRR
jgi:glycerol-3-phosphate acyltransferase PlsY